MLFVKDLEFKIKYKSLSFADKIDKFFEAFNLTEQVDDAYLKNPFNLFILDNFQTNLILIMKVLINKIIINLINI